MRIAIVADVKNLVQPGVHLCGRNFWPSRQHFFPKTMQRSGFFWRDGAGQGGTVLAKEMGNTIRSHSLKKLNP
jgi:hypothetical protein